MLRTQTMDGLVVWLSRHLAHLSSPIEFCRAAFARSLFIASMPTFRVIRITAIVAHRRSKEQSRRRCSFEYSRRSSDRQVAHLSPQEDQRLDRGDERLPRESLRADHSVSQLFPQIGSLVYFWEPNTRATPKMRTGPPTRGTWHIFLACFLRVSILVSHDQKGRRQHRQGNPSRLVQRSP